MNSRSNLDKATRTSSLPPPRWWGFNLLYLFSQDKVWDKYFPDNGSFDLIERNLDWITDWGFNFVRLPMDFRLLFQRGYEVRFGRNEAVLERVVEGCRARGLHLNLAFHTAPGYSIHHLVPGREHHFGRINTLFYDQKKQKTFSDMWGLLARTYSGVPSAELSFNLVNEPCARRIDLEFLDGVSRVTNLCSHRIWEQSPERTIVVDVVLNIAKWNPPRDPRYIYAIRGYDPLAFTCRGCPWVDLPITMDAYPFESATIRYSRRHLEADYERTLAQFDGLPLHCLEMGVFNRNESKEVKRWYRDVLSLLANRQIGFALWNLTGPFGILDNRMPGARTKSWHGHRLDTGLLDVLRSFLPKR
jgi:endoglucanase